MNAGVTRLSTLAVVLTLAGCSASGAASPVPAARTPIARHLVIRATSPIQHVVFIVQENRSFNNLFMGYPNALTQDYGYNLRGKKIKLAPQDLSSAFDMNHDSRAFFAACDGAGKLPGTSCKMDGWSKEVPKGAPKNYPYAYVPRRQIAPYWSMAKQYVLADDMFASNLDSSFIAHQYVVAADAAGAVDYPITDWGCEGGSNDTISTLTARRRYGSRIAACFDIPSIGTEADSAGLAWRFYAGAIGGDGGIWSSYQAESPIYGGPDWAADVINPPSQFLTDIAAGHLANVTWITPTYKASDHPGFEASQGPAWVASLVDAIGTSPFWSSTAIFIMWDDWGGWFDPVQPVYEDYDGLGFRVPLLMISAYAKHGYVTHVQYETSSVLRYIEDNFGLPQLAKSDARANDPASDAFDYSAKPRRFKEISGGKSASYWRRLDRTTDPATALKHIVGDD